MRFPMPFDRPRRSICRPLSVSVSIYNSWGLHWYCIYRRPTKHRQLASRRSGPVRSTVLTPPCMHVHPSVVVVRSFQWRPVGTCGRGSNWGRRRAASFDLADSSSSSSYSSSQCHSIPTGDGCVSHRSMHKSNNKY